MRIPAVPLATLLAAALLACGGDSNGPDDEGTARARAIHLSPDAPAVDIAVDGEVVADGITYGSLSEYVTVPAGAVDVTVARADNGDGLAEATATLLRDADYMILAANFATTAQALVLTENNAPPSEGFFKLRVVHAAPSAPAVDVHLLPPVEGELTVPLVQDVMFGTTSAYLERSESDGRVVLTAGGTLNVLIDTGPTEFTAGHIVTVILADATGGGAPFIYFFLEDET